LCQAQANLTQYAEKLQLLTFLHGHVTYAMGHKFQ